MPATRLPTGKLLSFFSPHAGPVQKDTLIESSWWAHGDNEKGGKEGGEGKEGKGRKKRRERRRMRRGGRRLNC
jgi:hypothetical protein